jgi:hypothetical protein
MPDDDGLDALSSKELHDRAVSYAKRHLDVKFFYNLAQIMPAAEAAAGEVEEMEGDMMRLSNHIDDVTESGEGQVADNLRPFYLEYLRKHNVKP